MATFHQMTLNPTLNADPIRSWIASTLAKNGLERPDGRWLFAYNQSRADFDQLAQLLKYLRAESGGFSQLILRKKAFSALFVFYAAGWWKNSYSGGAWDWSPIVESLGGDLHSFPQQLRSEYVTLGLRFWGHKPLEQGEGRKYIGAIAVHGGIPMKLLALGAGKLSTVLTQVLRQAGRYSWNLHQIEDAVEQYQHQLPAAYRRPEIANLLATFIDTVLQLKSEFKLSERIDPIQYLDAEVSGWRNRFPISMEVDAAQTLLVGLVREASAQRATTTADIFRCERRLKESSPGIYSMESVVTHSNRVAADLLAQYFGLNGADTLPRYLGIDLEVETRNGMIEGRFVLGAAEPVVSLTGRKLSFKGVAALMEHRLVLRDHSKDLSERVTASGGGALLNDEPMVFERAEDGIVRFIASGSVRVRSETAIVALPGGWIIECEGASTPERIGALEVGDAKLSVVEVNRDATLIHGELNYRIRTRQSATSVEMYQWSGARLQEAHGRQVFQDKLPPRLFRADEDSLVKVPEADQRWTRAGGHDVVQPKDARGPVDVVVSRDGETSARQRIFVLPAAARIRYLSGEGVGNGSIRFLNWESISVSVLACPEVACQISKTADTDCIELKLSTSGVPPPEVKVYIKWSGSPAELILHLPYPVTGGRFIRGDIGVLTHGSKVSVRELVGLRLQVFDTNPMNPKLYALQISMGAGNREISERHPLVLDSNARADIRLIDYQKTVESLLGLSDELDANVRVGLIVGNVKATEIHIARFACSLESAPNCLGLDDAASSLIGSGAWDALKVLANPLKDPTRQPIQLARLESVGVFAHAWGTEALDPEQSPWLIYPAEDSVIDFRPRLWVDESFSEADESPSSDEATGCSLSMALTIGDPGERWSQLHVVLGDMSADLSHASWPLLHGLWNRFHHLPLSALDVWRMLGKQSKSLLAFILSSPMPDHELTRALRRFRDETGWTPELNTLNDWRDVVATFRTYWKGQLSENEGLAKTVFLNQLESRLTLLKNEFHSLELVLDFMSFEVGNQPPQSLIALGAPSNVKVELRLKNLWIGGESLVNTQLFTVNAQRGNWPEKGFFEEAVAAFLESISDSDEKILGPLFRRLFWLQPGDFKMTAANMPMLCALWAATSTSRKWWGAPKNRLALRRLRDFDPVWFEQCFKHSFAVLLSVQGLVKPQEIVDFPANVQEMKFNE